MSMYIQGIFVKFTGFMLSQQKIWITFLKMIFGDRRDF